MAQAFVFKVVKLVWRGPQKVAQVQDEVRRRLATAGEMIVNEMKVNVSTSGDKGQNPSKPGQFPHANFGQLRNSIFWDYNPKFPTSAIDVGSSVKHGLYMEQGVSGGKVIRPKNAAMLTWVGKDGVRRFARQVVQGRIEPRPYIAPTIESMFPRLRAMFNRKMAV